MYLQIDIGDCPWSMMQVVKRVKEIAQQYNLDPQEVYTQVRIGWKLPTATLSWKTFEVLPYA